MLENIDLKLAKLSMLADSIWAEITLPANSRLLEERLISRPRIA